MTSPNESAPDADSAPDASPSGEASAKFPVSSLAAARIAVNALIDGGVRHVVISPGSRSAPMAYALAEAEAEGRVELLVRIDERSAGFTALGLALSTGSPAAVVTTSGTAVGNLLPAVMEANHAAVPLVVVSADRPEEMRGTGANQTTFQLDLFGDHVRFATDVPAGSSPQRAVETAMSAATGAFSGVAPGPVQLNLAFRDPLIPAPGEELPTAAGRQRYRVGSQPLTMNLPRASTDLPQHRTVVLAGHDAGPVAEAFARAHGFPLLAEPSSNARFGPNAIGPYRLLLAHFGPTAAQPIERVVLFGRPTLSRPVAALLARADVPSALYQPVPVAWYEPGRRTELPLESLADLADFAGRGAPEWLDSWLLAGAAAQHAIDGLLLDGSAALGGEATGGDATGDGPGGDATGDRPSGEGPGGDATGRGGADGSSEGGPVPLNGRTPATGPATPDGLTSDGRTPATGPAVGALVWKHSRGQLLLGSSNGIRDVDLAGLPAHEPAATVYANRGLAGIDGTISTATGIALGGRQETTVLLGDVTFLHDAGGLLLGSGEEEPQLRIVVLNDSGGAIFGLLEHGAVEETGRYAGAVERLFGTPHTVDIAALAAAYGVGHCTVSSTGALEEALAQPIRGRTIIEVRTDRHSLRALHARIHAAIASAVDGVLARS